MITYSRLGSPHHGRFGNQLFQIAATIGLAKKFGHEFKFPPWAYAEVFDNDWPVLGVQRWRPFRPIPEPHFHFQELALRSDVDYDVNGWRQSERYWEGAKDEVRNFFKFDSKVLEGVRTIHAKALARPCIAISVRRGDFVDNPNYWQIPALYYIQALFKHFPDWRDHNVLIFSDDIPYCRVHFEGLPGVHFADGPPAFQLALMSQCQHFIISNSTFSWWGAWLGEKQGSRVIRPAYNFDGQLKQANREDDFWPARWTKFDHMNHRLDLRDVTFTIPVFIDHRHRLENIGLSIKMLLKHLDTNILIMEQGSGQACAHLASWPARSAMEKVKWTWTKDNFFHRTKMLNDMAKLAETPIVVNWDCDVIIPPLQLWLAADAIRNGTDMVYPYDGRFARVPRIWFAQIDKTLDIGIVRDTEFKGKGGKSMPTTSVGGAIFFKREAFILGGMENQHMISFGPEDWERCYRFKTLGYDVQRIGGCLYHIDHWCGPDSSTRNPHFRRNHDELDRVRAMAPDDLAAYVEEWPWRDLRFI